MLAVSGTPFDSPDHFFEIKWDGFRAIAMSDDGGWRLMSRNGGDIRERFPETAALSGLPKGLAVDGEIVAFKNGKPSFDLLLQHSRRQHIPGPKPDAKNDISFIAFDLLYHGYDSLIELPFSARRERLEKTINGLRIPGLILSEGVLEKGEAFYARACENELEGVVAKRLSSAYAAGKRNGAWVKVKRRLRLHVAIIGFIEKSETEFQCILVAGSGTTAEDQGPLRYLGRVGSGFTAETMTSLLAAMRSRPRGTPIVACPEKGRWIEPGLYCTVSYAELTDAGRLRAPVFEKLVEA